MARARRPSCAVVVVLCAAGSALASSEAWPAGASVRIGGSEATFADEAVPVRAGVAYPSLAVTVPQLCAEVETDGAAPVQYRAVAHAHGQGATSFEAAVRVLAAAKARLVLGTSQADGYELRLDDGAVSTLRRRNETVTYFGPALLGEGAGERNFSLAYHLAGGYSELRFGPVAEPAALRLLDDRPPGGIAAQGLYLWVATADGVSCAARMDRDRGVAPEAARYLPPRPRPGVMRAHRISQIDLPGRHPLHFKRDLLHPFDPPGCFVFVG